MEQLLPQLFWFPAACSRISTLYLFLIDFLYFYFVNTVCFSDYVETINSFSSTMLCFFLFSSYSFASMSTICKALSLASLLFTTYYDDSWLLVEELSDFFTLTSDVLIVEFCIKLGFWMFMLEFLSLVSVSSLFGCCLPCLLMERAISCKFLIFWSIPKGSVAGSDTDNFIFIFYVDWFLSTFRRLGLFSFYYKKLALSVLPDFLAKSLLS